MKRIPTVLTALATSAALFSFWPMASAEEPPLVWTSTYTASPPGIDGQIDDVWANAQPLTVTIREALGGGDPTEVVLRALHTDDSLYVLAQWPDATRSDMRDPYIWNDEKKEYERPTTPDDQFALEFSLEGDLLVNMLPTEGAYTADVWHWKAGRSNLGGWVDDKRHIISQRRMEGAKQYSMGGHNTVYVARPMDEGRASYKTKPKPTAYRGDVVPSYASQEPGGSLADVRGKGVHDGKSWTLEMTRKFNTGHSDDAVIDPTRENICAIAVLNDELYWNHSVSQKISLRFSAEKLSRARPNRSSHQFAFDSVAPGALNRHWRIEGTRQRGPLATWKRVADASAPSPPNVLALTRPNHSSNGTYNICWYDELLFDNGTIALRFKAESGEVDQGGGLVWRLIDKDNYYICRANPLENNFRLYHVRRGLRKELASAEASIPTGQWHSIIVIHEGKHIECYLNGRKLLEVEDDTFPDAGYFGVWTKADAVTSFDDIMITLD